MSDDRIRDLEDEIKKMKEMLATQQLQIVSQTESLEDLKRQIIEPPYVLKVLEHIKQVGVINSTELKAKFGSLYGGNLSRLHDAVTRSRGYRIVSGRTRWFPTIYAYIPGDKPTTPTQIAIDYFQRIPLSKKTSSLNSMGRSVMIYRGPEGSLEEIQQTYNLNLKEAYEAWREILHLFEPRILINASDKKFRRKY